MSTKKRPNVAQTKPAGEPTATDPGAGVTLASEITNQTDPQSNRARQAEREAAEMFTLFRRELGSSGFVTLSRSHSQSGQFKPAYIGSMPADQFTIENVTAIYGGGDFIARARTAGGNFNEERRFTIDHTIPPKNPQAPPVEKKDAAPPATDVAAVLREMRESAPKQDNSLLLAMLSQQTTIIQAAMQRPEPKPDPMLGTALGQIVGLVEKLSNRLDRMEGKLVEAQKAPPSLRDQLMDAKELFEILDRGGSGEKPESFWKEFGKGAAEALVPLVKAHFAGAVPLSTGAPLLTAAPLSVSTAPASHLEPDHTGTNGNPQPDNPPQEMNVTLNFGLQIFRAQAMGAARAGLDAYAWTDSVVGSVPATMLNAVYKAANDENWFANIFGADPEALKHTGFLNQVRESILSKAFHAHVLRFAEVRKPAVETANAFLSWVTRDFDSTLGGIIEPDYWKEFFSAAALDPAWLEQLRTIIAQEFDTPPAEEFKPAGATPAASAETGAAPSRKTSAKAATGK